MIAPIWFLTGFLLPLVVAVLGAVCGAWARVGSARAAWSVRLGVTLGAVLAFAIGVLANEEWRVPFPPGNAVGRLMWYVLPAALMAEVVAMFLLRRATAAAVPGLLVALATPLLILLGSPRLSAEAAGGEREWSNGQAAIWLLGTGALALVHVGTVRHLQRRVAGRWLGVAVMGLAAAAGLLVMLSGSQFVGQMGLSNMAGCAGLLGVMCLLVWRNRSLSFDADSGWSWYVPALMTMAVLLVGHFYADVLLWHLIVLALAPVLVVALEALTGMKRMQRPVLAGVVRLVIVIVPVGIVLADAIRSFAKAMAETGAGE